MSVRFRSFVVFGAVALAAACSGPSSSAHPEPVAAANPSPAPAPDAVTSPTAPERTAMVQPAATEPAAMEPAASMSTPQVPAGAALTGEQVVEYVCSQCHSMEPPPLKAPPLTHLAGHLRESFPSVDEAVTHVVAYAPAPDPEQSILPERAQERFGLMPPQPLPEPWLEAATRYIWTLSDGTDVETGPPAMGRAGQGRGMMRRGGG